jgi:serine/threonine protein kinase
MVTPLPKMGRGRRSTDERDAKEGNGEMLTTTQHDVNQMVTGGRGATRGFDKDLVERYEQFLSFKRFHWSVYHRLQKRLGSGGQGVVFLTELRGADGFTLPVALKIFDPGRYENARAYDDAMTRIARVSAWVAMIQQDNLLAVQNFVDRDRIRMMVMEWVDGFDLKRLLSNQTLLQIKDRVSAKRWEYINDVIATAGPDQTRFKAGVAVAIVRQCLAALAALHRENIVHADVKPANVMLKRTGSAKIIDIGSAFRLDDPPPRRTCTPVYAAPEVLDGGASTPRSDLASLGYMLIEMLSGRSLFAGLDTERQLLEAKRLLPQRLSTILPPEVTCNALLMSFCRGLISPDPMLRFPDAEAATLVEDGAAAFLRQLIKGDMAAEYENEIRLLIGELLDLDASDEQRTV